MSNEELIYPAYEKWACERIDERFFFVMCDQFWFRNYIPEMQIKKKTM